MARVVLAVVVVLVACLGCASGRDAVVERAAASGSRPSPASRPVPARSTTTPLPTMPPGFCPIQAGPRADFTLGADGLTPPCLTVQPNQVVRVVNATTAPVTVSLDSVIAAADVAPGRAVTSAPLGGLVAPATYGLIAGARTAEVRLVAAAEP